MTGRALVEYGRLLHVLGIEAELMASSIPPPQLIRQAGYVPGCPGLTLTEAARHVGSVYRMLWLWLREGTRPRDWQREPRQDQDLPAFLRTGVAPLLTELAAHDPDEPCETWWSVEPNFGFWRRRMAHETTVHRVDVQGAARGPVDPVPEDIAIDGIDEVLTLWFEHRLQVLGIVGTRDYSVAVRTGGREWITRASPSGTSTVRVWSVAGDAGDTALRPGTENSVVSGTPMAVYLWLWGRVPDSRVTFEGDRDATAQLWALLRLATR